MKRMLIAFSAVILGSISLVNAQTTCPPPPNQVSVHVTANPSLDPATQLYTYTYTLASDAASVQDVVSFAVAFEGSIDNLNDPQGWDHGSCSPARRCVGLRMLPPISHPESWTRARSRLPPFQ